MRRTSPLLGVGMLLLWAGPMSSVRADDLNDYDCGTRRLRIRLHEGQWRNAAGVGAMFVLVRPSCPNARVAVDELRRAQAEAEVRCF